VTPTITLLTDFGLKDPFVGQMKGVLLRFCPAATLVDLTHQVPAFGVKVGAFYLGKSWKFFPDGTIHIAVVDPGVGTDRKALVLYREGHFFVGPDNGLFSEVMEGAKAFSIHAQKVVTSSISNTFHGRDLFAPVAGMLASGRNHHDFCEEIPMDSLVTCPLSHSIELGSDEIIGEVLFVDHFGNLVTNIEAESLASTSKLHFKGKALPMVRTYAEAKLDYPCFLVNSFGMLEIALPMGSAADFLSGKVGDEARLRVS